MTLLEGPQRTLTLVVGLVGLTVLGIVVLGLVESPHDDRSMPTPPRMRVAATPLAGGPLSAADAALADAPATYHQVRPRAGTMQPKTSDEGMPGLSQSIGAWEFQHIDVQRRMVDWVASGERALPLAPNVFSVTQPRLVFFRQALVASGASGRPAGGAAGGLSGASSSPAATTQLGDKILIEASRGRAELPADGPARFSFEGTVLIQSSDLRLRTEELTCTIEQPTETPPDQGASEPADSNSSASSRRIRIACAKAVHLSRRTPEIEVHASSLEADLSLDQLLLGPPVLVQLGPEASAPLRATAGLDQGSRKAQSNGEARRHMVVESQGPLRLTLELAGGGPGDAPDWSTLLEDSPDHPQVSTDRTSASQALTRLHSGQMFFSGGVRVHDTDDEFELRCQDLTLFFSPDEPLVPGESPTPGTSSQDSPGSPPGTAEEPRRQLTFQRAIASGDVRLRAQMESRQDAQPETAPWTLKGERLEMMSLPGLRQGNDRSRQFTGRAVLTAASGKRIRAEQLDRGSWLEAQELVMADIDALEPDQWRRVAVARGEVRGLLDNPTAHEDTQKKPGDDKGSSRPRPHRFSLSGDTLKMVLTSTQPQAKDRSSAGPLSGQVETLVLRGNTTEPAALQAEPGGFSARAASIAYEPNTGQGSLRSSSGVRPVLKRGDDRLSAESVDFDYRAGKLALLGNVDGVVNRTALKTAPGSPRPGLTARYRIRAARLDAEMDMAADQVRSLTAGGRIQHPELTGPDVVEVDQEPLPGVQVLSLRSPGVSWDLQAALVRLTRPKSSRRGISRPRLKYGDSWIEADLMLHDSQAGRASAHGHVLADLQLPRRTTDDDAVPETGDARRVHLEAARAVAHFAPPSSNQETPGAVGELLSLEAHGLPADTSAGNPVAAPVRVTALQDDGSAVGMRLLANSVEWDHVNQIAHARGHPARAERWTPRANQRPGNQPRRTVSPSAEHLSAREIVYATSEGRLELRGDAQALVQASSLRGAATSLEGSRASQARPPSAQALVGGPGSATATKREQRYRINADSVDARLEPDAETDQGPSQRRAGVARLRDFTAKGNVRVRELVRPGDTDLPLAVDADEARYDRDTGLLVLVGDPVRVEQRGQRLETGQVTIRLGGVTGR